MHTDHAPRHALVSLTQSGLRNHNERLLLSLIQRFGPMPGSELSRLSGLSAQTVSVILRSLEQEGLVLRGDPQKGKVGKPSIPMRLNPDGACSFGLKIGRRSAELALMGLDGTLRGQHKITYRFPLASEVFPFLREGMTALMRAAPALRPEALCGIGIAAPFEIWKWHELVGADTKDFLAWKDIDFAEEVAKFSPLPVSIINDATSACRAQFAFGDTTDLTDFAYLFVGSFIGGGVVMNGALYQGRRGNAGALGSLRSVNAEGRSVQLLDTASLYLLEQAIAQAGGDPSLVWRSPDDWTELEPHLDPWIATAARQIAMAALSACAVIDFEAIVIDGAFPDDVRNRLVQRIEDELTELDSRGLIVPQIRTGQMGGNARVIGAAFGPLADRYFLADLSGITTAPAA